MTDFLTALSLALVIEGVAYALFPNAMQRMVTTVLAMSPQTLRLFGLVSAVSGVLGVWAIRSALLTP